MDQTSVSQSLDDPLMACLLRVCELEGLRQSAISLSAGLPLVEGKLTPDLFLRAAERANLDAKIFERDLEKISELVLPVVLVCNENNALVLESFTADGEAIIWQGASTQRINLLELKRRYTGLCIFTRPDDQHILPRDEAPDSQWFWQTLSRSWRIYRDVLIASLVINVFVIANPLFVMNVYDRVVPNSAIETLWALAIGILVLFCFDFTLRLLRTYFIEIAGKKSDVILSVFIFERVLGAPYSHHPQSVGAFANRIRDFESLRNFITSATVSAFVDLPFVVLFLVVVAYIGGPIVWVPIIAIPIILFYAWITQRRLKQLVAKTFVASAQKNATLVEAMSNLETLKSLAAESKVLKVWESTAGLLAGWGVKWRFFSASATTFSGFIQQLSSVFVIIVGVYAIAENNLTQGALIACVILVSRALAPLAQLSGLLVQYHQSKIALESLEELVAVEQERPVGRQFIGGLEFKGKIQLKHVEFAYPDESNLVLRDISLDIKPREKVAIIGRIGSGKSSLQKLLLGLYRASGGSILIDNIDLTQIDPAELRGNVGYVAQESTLFSTNIRDNIAFHHNVVSDAEVARVAAISGVADFVNQHPLGYERMVSERGSALSGGQCQAITLARALVNKPPIVLLDEPTSAMDNTSEAKIIERLKLELADRTLLLITHKSAMLSLVDRIVVMDGGKIVANGPKDKVMDALQRGQIRGD